MNACSDDILIPERDFPSLYFPEFLVDSDLSASEMSFYARLWLWGLKDGHIRLTLRKMSEETHRSKRGCHYLLERLENSRYIKKHRTCLFGPVFYTLRITEDIRAAKTRNSCTKSEAPVVGASTSLVARDAIHPASRAVNNPLSKDDANSASPIANISRGEANLANGSVQGTESVAEFAGDPALNAAPSAPASKDQDIYNTLLCSSEEKEKKYSYTLHSSETISTTPETRPVPAVQTSSCAVGTGAFQSKEFKSSDFSHSQADGSIPFAPPCDDTRQIGKEFKRLWDAYPISYGEDNAYRVFADLRKAGHCPTVDYLLSRIEWAKKSRKWQLEKGRFVTGLVRWLSEGCWKEVLDFEASEIRKSRLQKENEQLEAKARASAFSAAETAISPVMAFVKRLESTWHGINKGQIFPCWRIVEGMNLDEVFAKLKAYLSGNPNPDEPIAWFKASFCKA